MSTPLLQENWFVWGIGLIIGFPAIMVLVNELVLKVQRKSPAFIGILQEIRNVVLPTLASLVLLTQIIELDSERTSLRIVQTLFWVSLIHVGLALVNAFLFTGAKPNTCAVKTGTD